MEKNLPTYSVYNNVYKMYFSRNLINHSPGNYVLGDVEMWGQRQQMCVYVV